MLQQKWNNNLSIFFKGFAMGIAEVIPGISGGSIALITGIYPRLIRTIESFDRTHALAFGQLLLFFYQKTRRNLALAKIKQLDWPLLLPLLSGMAVAIAIMTHVISFLLETYAYFVYSFIFGVMLVAIISLLRHIRLGWFEWIALLFSCLVVFLFTHLEFNNEGSYQPLILLLSGAVAVCAMILPGISGAYLLLVLGQYQIIMEAARGFDISVLTPFILGLIIGLFTFVRILRLFLDRFFSLTMAALSGMMIGSLGAIWPPYFQSTEMTDLTLWIGGLLLALFGVIFALVFVYHFKLRLDTFSNDVK